MFFELSEKYERRDILAALKGDASRGSYVTLVDSDGWESTVSDRRPWQCHATGTRSRRGVASYHVVLCRSAWSAYLFGSGIRRGKHRINCQFSTLIPQYDEMRCEPSPCPVKVKRRRALYPRAEARGFSALYRTHKKGYGAYAIHRTVYSIKKANIYGN